MTTISRTSFCSSDLETTNPAREKVVVRSRREWGQYYRNHCPYRKTLVVLVAMRTDCLLLAMNHRHTIAQRILQRDQ